MYHISKHESFFWYGHNKCLSILKGVWHHYSKLTLTGQAMPDVSSYMSWYITHMTSQGWFVSILQSTLPIKALIAPSHIVTWSIDQHLIGQCCITWLMCNNGSKLLTSKAALDHLRNLTLSMLSGRCFMKPGDILDGEADWRCGFCQSDSMVSSHKACMDPRIYLSDGKLVSVSFFTPSHPPQILVFPHLTSPNTWKLPLLSTFQVNSSLATLF